MEYLVYMAKIAAANGKINGYVKPFIKNLKIGNAKNNNPIQAIINGGAAIIAKALKNSQQKNIATKINISGEIDDPDTSILSIIGYLIRHAFIQSLLPQIDKSVKLQNVHWNNKKKNKLSTQLGT